jgi:hypothetical protein
LYSRNVRHGIRVMPAITPLNCRRPSMNRAATTIRPPRRAKKLSARSSRSGVRKT